MGQRSILPKLLKVFLAILLICDLGSYLGCTGASGPIGLGNQGLGNQANGGGGQNGTNESNNGILNSTPGNLTMGDCTKGDCSKLQLSPPSPAKSVKKSYTAFLDDGTFEGIDIYCYQGKPSPCGQVERFPCRRGSPRDLRGL